MLNFINSTVLILNSFTCSFQFDATFIYPNRRYDKATSTPLGYEIVTNLVFIEELHLWIQSVLYFEKNCGSHELLISNCDKDI